MYIVVFVSMCEKKIYHVISLNTGLGMAFE